LRDINALDEICTFDERAGYYLWAKYQVQQREPRTHDDRMRRKFPESKVKSYKRRRVF
jgi:hypothetical protein